MKVSLFYNLFYSLSTVTEAIIKNIIKYWALSNPTSYLRSLHQLFKVWTPWDLTQKWGKIPDYYILPCVCGRMWLCSFIDRSWNFIVKNARIVGLIPKRAEAIKSMLSVQNTSTAMSPALPRRVQSELTEKDAGLFKSQCLSYSVYFLY